MNVEKALEHLTRAQRQLRAAKAALRVAPPPLLGASVFRPGALPVHSWQAFMRETHGVPRLRVTYDKGAPLWSAHEARFDRPLGVEWSWMSFKTLDPVRIYEVLASIPEERRMKTIVSVWHEPEENIEKGEFTLDEWTRAQRNLAGVGHGLGVRTAAVLMAWTFNPSSGRNPDDFIAGAAVHDFIGFDGYDKLGRRSPADIFDPCVAWAAGLATQPAIRETGTKSTEWRQWFLDLADYHEDNGLFATCVWDSPRKDNYALTADQRSWLGGAFST